MAQLVRAPPCHGGGREFESLLGRLNGIIAQLGEHLPYKQRVIGSSPIGPIDMDGFPSGQRGQTVNLLATPSKVRILLHPLADMILGIGQRRLLSLHCMLTKGIGTHRT